MNAVEIKNLCKSFDGIKAVDDVSFSIPEGSIYGIIGRNGAGKTTTLRMIMNIFLPDSGEVIIRGVKAGDDFRAKTGYLPEERGLYKKLKVLETILFFAELKYKSGKAIEQRAIDLLKRFDLYDRRMSKIEDLSKGNQQKVQFISTIIHDPDFIVLDEPFSGLDPINTNILKEIILELKSRGKIIIFSTHLMDFAEKMCDSITMIDKGKVILSGKLNDIKMQFAQRNISLNYDGDILFLRTSPLIERIEDFGKTVGIKVKHNNDIQEVLKLLVQNDVKIHSFISNEVTLHEIFVSLAGNDDSVEKKKKV